MNAKVVVVTIGTALGLGLLVNPAPRLAWADPIAAPPSASDPMVAAVEHRQREIRRMSAAMRQIGSFLKNEGATVADVGADAVVIRTIAAEMTHSLFPEGSAVGVGHSGARAEIWQQWDIFKERASNLAAAANRLSVAAATGNPDALRAPIAAVGQACVACHELFRTKKP